MNSKKKNKLTNDLRRKIVDDTEFSKEFEKMICEESNRFFDKDIYDCDDNNEKNS